MADSMSWKNIFTKIASLTVSDPYHHRYGLHLSAAEVDELVKPTKEADDLVRDWLLDYDIHDFSYSSSRDWININLPVHLAESLLDTKYYIYRHADDGTTALRASRWSLPMHLHDHIEAVHPTNAFFRTERQSNHLKSRSEVPSIGLGENGAPTYDELVRIDRTEMGHMDIPDIKDLPENPRPSQACNPLATSPLCLRTLYGTLDYTPQAPERVRVGLVNYLDQVNNQSDIEIFLKRYRPDAVGAAYKIKTEIVALGSNQQAPVTEEQAARTVGLEGNLNAETIIGLAYPIPVTAYNVGGRAPFQRSRFSTENKNEPYLEWLQYMLAQPDLPQVITTSYADEEQTVPYWYAKRACQGFAQLGARGVSVLFASGDEGVGADGMCWSNNGSNKPMFLPTFPASCPYVTAVGGTRNWDPEIAGFDARRTFVAGGGFSNYFPRPHYQKDTVDAYVNGLGSLHDGLYSKTGRGYPDISVRGYHYITVWNGTARIIDGTSASSPAAAAIFSLVNDALAAEGKPALGWLNPWIYSKGFGGFTDVVAGSNPGCNTAGFPAKKGWDAATGFGTPVSGILPIPQSHDQRTNPVQVVPNIEIFSSRTPVSRG
ncbi:MAG: hypothetical protein Q9161_009011 [Pseudevernia consocians]